MINANRLFVFLTNPNSKELDTEKREFTISFPEKHEKFEQIHYRNYF